MTFLSKITGGLLGSGASKRGDVSSPGMSSAYMRGGRGVVFNGWRPALRDAQDDITEAWDDAAARVVDTIHNSGWLAGAIDQAVANTVGNGLRLKAMPEAAMLGMSEDEARTWARTVERRFELWARHAQECDISGHRKFGQMQAAAFRTWLATGEILSELVWRKRDWNVSGTKVRLISPTRLCRQTDMMRRLIDGVYVDRDDMPIGYRAQRKDPFLGNVEYDVPARDALGRPAWFISLKGCQGRSGGSARWLRCCRSPVSSTSCPTQP